MNLRHGDTIYTSHSASIIQPMSETIKPIGRESDKFMLRLPDGMRDRIADEAKKNGRSMNAEIVHVLTAFYNNKRALKEMSLSEMPDTNLGNEINRAATDAVMSAVNEVLKRHGLLEKFNTLSQAGSTNRLIDSEKNSNK